MTSTTVTDLRGKIDAIENKKLILASQRDDIAFAALVDREPAAIKQADAINDELTQLTHEEAMLNAALRTAQKRDADAKVAEQTSRKRADLERAVSLLPEALALAERMDAAMKGLHADTTAYDALWAQIRELSGAGPHKTARGVHLGRSFRVGLRGLPGIVADMVPPNERHGVAELDAGWSLQVRNIAARETAPVKQQASTTVKPKNTKAAAAA
jgi:hypothetical protein